MKGLLSEKMQNWKQPLSGVYRKACGRPGGESERGAFLKQVEGKPADGPGEGELFATGAGIARGKAGL